MTRQWWPMEPLMFRIQNKRDVIPGLGLSRFMLSLASSWKQEQWGTATLESAQWLYQRCIGLYVIADVDAGVDQIGEYFVFVVELKWGLDAASLWNRQPEEIGDFVMCVETETLNRSLYLGTIFSHWWRMRTNLYETM